MFTLRRIDAEDQLAQLFNAYMKGLSTLEIMSEPTYETMRGVHEAFRGSRRQKNEMAQQARRFYELHVLGGALRGIYHNLLGALETLEKFFDEYGGNLTHYAAAQRMESLDEHGGGEDDDWREDGVDEQGRSTWAVVYKDDPEALAPYTLRSRLAYYFGSDTRGEHLGTSDVEHFWRYTLCVENESAFSFRKMMEMMTGQEAAIVQVQPDGTHTPMTLGDHLEDELNQDIRNGELVQVFQHAIRCQNATGWFFNGHTDDTTGPEVWRAMLRVLQGLRDLDPAVISPEQ